MGNKIQTTYSKGASHWITAVPTMPYTQEMNFPEVGNPELMADALLAEFSLTDEADRQKFRHVLIEWLNEMPADPLATAESAKVRDFIYEMF